MELATKFKVHHYFNDKSHTLDAFIKNKAEIEFLSIVSEVANILTISCKLEAEVVKEGGFVEIWTFLGESAEQINLLIGVLTLILTISQSDDRETSDLKKENLKLSVEERKLRINRLKKEILVSKEKNVQERLVDDILHTNHKVVTRRSNYYKNISHVEKIRSVAFSKLDKTSKEISKEKNIYRENFKDFIIENDNLPAEILERVELEIVAPVLNYQKNAKWRAIYNEQNISFSMNDNIFKQDVFNQKILFTNGTILVCDLKIIRKVNELGEIIVATYAVEQVHEHITSGIRKETRSAKTNRQIKNFKNSQGDLFS